ncbi:MAG: PLP-dependent aminotransferase family protein [Oligoflexus sp.]
MPKVLFVLTKGDRDKTSQISDAIREAIQEGRLRPEEKLPSSRELAKDLGVHRQTVLVALEQLVNEGWIVAELRRAYKVAPKLPDHFYAGSPDSQSAIVAPALVLATVLKIPKSSEATVAPDIRWNFRSGRSDLRLFPIDELKSCLTDGLRRKKAAILDYGNADGYPMLLEELSNYLRLVRSIRNRDIIVTNGCQEALYIAAKLLIAPGDKVAMEALSYPIAMNTLRNLGADLHAVAIDGEGVIPEALDDLCQREKIKLLFLTPNHHFPTTVTMSSQRRQAIYAVAVRHSIIILEDDFDHEYHYVSSPPAPIATIDSQGLVIYASSLSKIMFPAARIGFLALPKGVKAKFVEAKLYVSIQSGLLMQDAIARWMKSGGALAHLNRTRRIYEQRLQGLNRTLQEFKDKGVPLQWRVPDGGMAVWVKTDWNTKLLSQQAEKRGLLVQYEEASRIDGGAGQHLRIGFAQHTEEETYDGLSVLFQLADELQLNKEKSL